MGAERRGEGGGESGEGVRPLAVRISRWYGAGLDPYEGKQAGYNRKNEEKDGRFLHEYTSNLSSYPKAWQLLGNYENAIEDFTKAIRVNPKRAENYNMRGFAKFEKNDFSGSIQDHTAALQIDPKNARAFYCRGLAKSAIEDMRGALMDLQQFFNLTRDTQDPEILQVKQSLSAIFPQLK